MAMQRPRSGSWPGYSVRTVTTASGQDHSEASSIVADPVHGLLFPFASRSGPSWRVVKTMPATSYAHVWSVEKQSAES